MLYESLLNFFRTPRTRVLEKRIERLELALLWTVSPDAQRMHRGCHDLCIGEILGIAPSDQPHFNAGKPHYNAPMFHNDGVQR